MNPWECPHEIARPLMRQHWEQISYLHWPIDAAHIQAMLPAGLDVDTHDGTGWVGLVPFRLRGVGPPRGPSVPYLGTFAETNVRTYVVGPDGPGVWFHSLDIDRGLPVLAARSGYGLPYNWAAMAIRDEGRLVTYAAVRRRPHRVRAHSAVTLHIGDPIPNERLTSLEVFLTARWRLYARRRGRLVVARVSHPPWPLHRARVVTADDGFVSAAGYPAPEAEPHVLYSSGVPVLAERPRAAL